MPKRSAASSCLLDDLRNVDIQISDKPYVLLFAEWLNVGEVAVKLAPKHEEYVSTERENITYVTKFIVPFTPHMLPAIAVGKCKVSEWLRAVDEKNTLEEMWARISTKKDKTLQYVVEPRVHGASLWDIQLENVAQAVDVAIQVAQALTICEEKLFVHNDLHFHNIFFFELDALDELEYKFPPELSNFSFPTKIKITIFDYDESFIARNQEDFRAYKNKDWTQFMTEWKALAEQQLQEEIPVFSFDDNGPLGFIRRITQDID